MASAEEDPSLAYALPFKLTPTIRSGIYDLISPTNPVNREHARGKIVLVTGGGTGIGAASAKVWAQAGAAGIVIAGRRKEKLDGTADELRRVANESADREQTVGKVLATQADITSFDSMTKVFGQVKVEFGRCPDVVIASAGRAIGPRSVGEEDVERWWEIWETQVKGLHNTVVSYIRSQPNPQQPGGTLVFVGAGMSGFRYPGMSAYQVSKYAAGRYLECVDVEYPTLRVFNVMPGIANTDMIPDDWKPYATDDPGATGALALYLSQPRADFLKGGVVSVKWDLEEVEARKDEIVEKQLLKSTWLPVLPCNGGQGLV